MTRPATHRLKLSHLKLPLFVSLVFVLAACSEEGVTPSITPQAVSGGTVAPDLLTVGNFRPAGENVNGSGGEDTLVDFTFDEPATVSSCCAGFQLVPVDGGTPLEALTFTDGDGTTTITFAFEGEVQAGDIARGTVDQNIVQAAGAGSGTNNPPQAAAVGNGGNTADPDLVSVTKDGDQLLFEFDESIAEDDDVVQNTSGLRFYTQNADIYLSSAVKQRSTTTLSAIYDLPAGVTLDDAVGGFVVAGTVAGDQLNPNELDEVAPVGDTGAVVCPAPDLAGTTGDGSGPTEAPDLLEVGNFRRGPFTDDYEPTTCVDFVFDQAAYLNGGALSNFHLVPLSASDALDGSTNAKAESDQTGDVVVTVVFLGELEPADFARGYVDTGVVNSAQNNVSAANPLNINQAANIEPNTFTENPDLAQNLTSVERQSEVWLIFKFDEPLTDDDVIQNTSGLRVYFPATSQSSTIPDAGAVKVKRVDERTLRAKFKDLPEGYRLRDAVGAYVVQGTVQAAKGSRGGNDGKSAFDETFLTIDWPGSR